VRDLNGRPLGYGDEFQPIGSARAASAELAGLLIGPFGSRVIAPSLLVLVLLNTVAFAWMTFRYRHNLGMPE
jgi:hypothetical protein